MAIEGYDIVNNKTNKMFTLTKAVAPYLVAIWGGKIKNAIVMARKKSTKNSGGKATIYIRGYPQTLKRTELIKKITNSNNSLIERYEVFEDIKRTNNKKSQKSEERSKVVTKTVLDNLREHGWL